MSRDLRDTIKLAEGEGLTFLDSQPGGKHMRVRFTKPGDDVLVVHVNAGSKKLDQSKFNKLNFRSMFRRFARGVYHDLIIEKASHV